MSAVVGGKARIEAQMAARIAAVLGTTPALWLNLQNAVAVWDARQELRDWRPARVYTDVPEKA